MEADGIVGILVHIDYIVAVTAYISILNSEGAILVAFYFTIIGDCIAGPGIVIDSNLYPEGV